MFKDFNVDGRFSSLKHEISLMNQREKRYSNYTDDYHLCFTKFILTEESLTTCSGSNRDFQQPFLKILKSFLLFKFSMIGLTEISKYLVLNPRRFGAPKCSGPLPYGPNAPLWKGLPIDKYWFTSNVTEWQGWTGVSKAARESVQSGPGKSPKRP